jgi:DNA-binding transcriptional LysR family regulator
MNKRSEYYEKLTDPRWQKKRLEVFQRDDFCCQLCFDAESPLAVHHRYYDKSLDPWEYPLEALVTLCETCHQSEYEDQYEADRALVRAFRSAGFMNVDLDAIAAGLKDYTLPHVAEVTSTMIGLLFKDTRLQRALIEELVFKGKK